MLIVEDEPLMAGAIRDGLRLEEIAGDIAGDGDSAVDCSAQHPNHRCHLIGLSACVMPETTEEGAVMPTEIIVEKNLRVAMRDGVGLATTSIAAGRRAAARVVQRTPYDKEGRRCATKRSRSSRRPGRLRGVSCRTRAGATSRRGEFDPFFDEGADGADTMSRSPPSPVLGEVGIAGGSYFGATQWLAACERPPA